MLDVTVNSLFKEAMTAYREGRMSAALDALHRLLAAAPDNLNGLQLAGAICFEQSNWKEAEAHFRSALQIKPDMSGCWFNVAKVVGCQGRWPEAEQLDREGLARAPDDVRGLDHLGLTLREQYRLTEAEPVYLRCLEVAPNDVAAWNNLGTVYLLWGRAFDAAHAFAKTLELKPDSAEAAYNLGNALRETMQVEEAQAVYEKAVALHPDNMLGWACLLLNSQYLPRIEPAAKFELHRRFGEQLLMLTGYVPRPRGSGVRPRLHIGYVSSELYQHAVSHFLRPLLEHHDRSRFKISLFSNSTYRDAVTSEMEAMVDEVHCVYSLTDDEVVKLTRDREVDILVDLNGHSGFARLGVFSRRGAPIQVSYLGYPDTTGVIDMDYRLTDAIADPPGPADAWHTEKLWRLPGAAWCYRPYADAPEVAGPRNAGEPVVFGSFNALPKINPPLIALWADILRQVPGSRLAMKAKPLLDPAIRARVWSLFQDHGIDESRLDFRVWKPAGGHHLLDYLSVDIALDPFPYHGTTTTCDALWMGVPVVTLAGHDHHSRVGVSLLRTVGLENLVAQSAADYVAKAVFLACDQGALHALRQGLRARVAASPLVDGRRFAAGVEAAYSAMVAAEEKGAAGA